MKCNKNRHVLLLSKEDACCLGMQSWKTVQGGIYTERLWLRHSRMTKTDAVQQNSLVRVCHPIAQIHITFLMHMKKCILQMCFHLVFAHVFLSDKKNNVQLSWALKFFMHIFRIYPHSLVFSFSVFFYAIFQNMHKNRWMETAIN